MEPQARYSVVGASVLLLLFLMIAASTWLISSGNVKDTNNYTLVFSHQSIDGLQNESEVRMKGIRIGSVTRFSFSKRQPGSVEVTATVDASAPVRESSRGVVDRNLVTGLATIRIVTPDENSPLLHGSTAAAIAVIPEGESQLQQFSESMNQLALRADDTMRRIGETLSPANQAALAETLENLRVASGAAGALTHQMTTTLARVGAAADGLQATARVATTDFHRLADRYDVLGEQTQASVRDAGEAVRKLSADVSRLAVRTEDVLGDADVELHETGRQVRAAAESLDTTTRKVADPRALLFGPARESLGPGEARQ